MSTPTSRTILLVEDDALIAMAEKKTLEKLGYTVITALSGEKAIDLVNEDESIDLILMDIDLGARIDGTEAARIILQERDMPVVFLSSHTEPEVVALTEKITSYGYVVKNSGTTVLDASIKMAFKLFEAKQKLTEELTARKETEAALLESEEKFRALFEKGPIGVAYHEMVYDDEGKAVDYRFLNANTSYRELTGVDPRGKCVTEAFPGIEKDPFDWIGTFGRVATTGEEIRFEQYLQPNNRWYDCVAYQVKPGYFVAAFMEITQRKQAEEDRAEKVRLLSRTEEIARIGNWQLDIRTKSLSWSDGVFNLFGCSPRQFAATYEAFFEFVHPEDRAAVDAAYSRSVQNNQDRFEIEHRIIRADTGETRYVLERCDHDCDDQGTIIRSTGIVQDITEYRVMERTVTRQKQYLEAILSTTADGFWVIAPDSRISEVNAAYCRMSGYNAKELTAMTITDLDATESEGETVQRIERITRNGSETFETQHRRKDGSVFDLEVTVSRFDRAEGMCFVCFGRDISDRKQKQDTLMDERRRLAAIIEGTDAGTWERNVQTGETRYNERWASIIGYTLDEFSPGSIGTWKRFCHQEDLRRSEEAMDAHFRGETERCEAEVRMRHRQGHWVWVLTRGKVITWTPDGKPEWIFGFHIEITKRKNLAEKHLTLANAAAALQGCTAETISYKDLAETMRYLSGAVSAALNLLDFHGTTFTTMAVASLQEPREETATGHGHQIGGDATVVPISTAEEVHGNFTLMNSGDTTLQDEDLVETYASMVGITMKRIRTEQANAQLITEKETLLREVHHRVKNNMNVMTSLLSLHADTLTNQEAIGALRAAEGRLRCMQTLYDQLHTSHSHSSISLVEYLQTLVPQVVDLFPAGNTVAVSVSTGDTDCYTMSAKRLSTVGLIVNELLTNTLKYAFPATVSFTDTHKPAIRVTVQQSGGEIAITVEDNGVGLPESFDRENTRGFGMLMMEALTLQLRGTLQFEAGAPTRDAARRGTRGILSFPLHEPG